MGYLLWSIYSQPRHIFTVNGYHSHEAGKFGQRPSQLSALLASANDRRANR
jgi:hypothetical protein